MHHVDYECSSPKYIAVPNVDKNKSRSVLHPNN